MKLVRNFSGTSGFNGMPWSIDLKLKLQKTSAKPKIFIIS